MRGPRLFDGYLREPAPFIDGWYPTGDLADVVDEGYLSIVGAHCEGALAPFKQPRRLEVVDEIPRTASTGQVLRRLLVEQLSPR